jgi:putative PIN family toxin of toxin-antitoxin system
LYLNQKNILAAIEAKSTWCYPKTKIDVIRDKDDNKFLELANESKANFLITGNTNDFTMKKFKKTFIVTPKEYWEKHKT